MYFDNFVKAKKAPGIPRFKMNAPFYKTAKRGDVGLELELEASNSLPWEAGVYNAGVTPCPVTRALWVAKEDHSLRGGAEYVTASPVSIEAVPGLVTGLYDNLAKFKTKLRLSNRCSTHVHLNASTWKVDRLVSFYLIWALFEPLLIDWCGPRRKVNHFCLSILDAPSTLNNLNSFLKTGEWRFNEGDKYSALNLRRLHDIGSVEVRCGDAWEDPNKVIEWARFLHGMAMYTADLYPTDIPSRISGDTPLGILAEICNLAGTPDIYQEILSMSSDTELTSRAMLSFREAMHLAFIPPWEEWRPLINREYIPNPFDKARKGEPPGVLDNDRIQRLAQAALRPQRLRNARRAEIRVEPEPPPEAGVEDGFPEEPMNGMQLLAEAERLRVRERIERQRQDLEEFFRARAEREVRDVN